jgi:hypothetical protein
MPDDDDQHNDDPANLRGLLRDRTKERDQLKGLAETGAEAVKELAIVRAGITDEKTAKLLLKAHDGEWTPDAVKATAAEYNLLPGDNKPDARQDAIDQLSAVGAGQRGTSDTRVAAANDDEAIQEELVEHMARHIPKSGKLANKKAYIAELDQIMSKFQVRRS